MYTDASRMAEVMAFMNWTENEIPSNRLAEFASAATDEVDAKVRQVHTVPLGDNPEDVPSVIVQITTALAVYQATLTWYGSTDLDDKDPVVRRWKWASDLLESIRKGETTIGPVEGDDSDVEDGTVVNPSYSGLISPDFFQDLDRDPNSFGRWVPSGVFDL